MWQETAELNILNVAIYIRVTGRGPFNELAIIVSLAWREPQGLERRRRSMDVFLA